MRTDPERPGMGPENHPEMTRKVSPETRKARREGSIGPGKTRENPEKPGNFPVKGKNFDWSRHKAEGSAWLSKGWRGNPDMVTRFFCTTGDEWPWLSLRCSYF
jgi:hypothetical protein